MNIKISKLASYFNQCDKSLEGQDRGIRLASTAMRVRLLSFSICRSGRACLQTSSCSLWLLLVIASRE